MILRWDLLLGGKKDEVVSLLSITTIDGPAAWRYPVSTQPQHANAIVRRVITRRGAEVVSAHETGERKAGTTMIAPIRKGERGPSGWLFIQSRRAHSYAEERRGDLADAGRPSAGGALQPRCARRRNCATASNVFRDLFENSPDAIFVEDLTGKVLDGECHRPASCRG